MIPDQTLPGIPWDALPLVKIEKPDGSEQDLVLVPTLPRGNELLAWKAHADADKVRFHTLGTKRRMMCPMLNDDTRNAAYERAIRDAVARCKIADPQGRGPRVLDIGAGTGLLSLIAARAGARHVLACEMNPALAPVVEKVVTANGLADIITVVAARSTDIALNQGEEPYDLIVTETLDSDLLNEGIVGSMRDACKRLGRPQCELVPNRAKVYGQVFGCAEPSLLGFNVGEFHLNEKKKIFMARERKNESLELPIDKEQIVDLHASSLPGLCALSERAEILHVDFAAAARDDDSIDFENGTINICKQVPVSGSGVARMVIASWELFLSPRRALEKEDTNGAEPMSKRLKVDRDEQPLSTCPLIAENDSRWQDHWFPVIFPLKRALRLSHLKKNGALKLKFQLLKGHLSLESIALLPLRDSALFERSSAKSSSYIPYTANGRRRVAHLADSSRVELLCDSLTTSERYLRQEQACLGIHVIDFSDGGLCSALSRVALQADSVTCVDAIGQEENACSTQRQFWERICASVKTVDGKSVNFTQTLPAVLESQGYILSSDLFYSDMASNNVLCAFRFLNQVRNFMQKVPDKAKVRAAPQDATIMGAIVSFPKLARALRPPGKLLGFDHAAADQPWETDTSMLSVPYPSYEHKFLSQPLPLARLDFINGSVVQVEKSKTTAVPLNRACNDCADDLCLLVWIECKQLWAPKVQLDGRASWYEEALLRVISRDDEVTKATVLDVLQVEVEMLNSTVSLRTTSPYY